MTTIVRITACGNPTTTVVVDVLDRAINSFESYRLQPGQTMIQHMSPSRSIVMRESSVVATLEKTIVVTPIISRPAKAWLRASGKR